MTSQRGITLTSFLVVLIVVAFFLYIGMKLFPMYQEYYAVRSAMKSLAKEPGVGNMDVNETLRCVPAIYAMKE